MSSLTLVSLPIGNIKDITIRAREVLESQTVFYAEDTRVFKKLLDGLGIQYSSKEIDSFHEHSSDKIDVIVERIKSGTEIFLVSDAGSPLISDPAYPLIKRMREEGIEVRTIPGVTSVVTALELSCLPPLPFHFWGFISRAKNERVQFFKELGNIVGTHIFFESPHRIEETVNAFFEVSPAEELVITRELTKHYESVYRLNSNNMKSFSELIIEKGEFVVLFHVPQSNKKLTQKEEELKNLVLDFLNGKAGTKKLAKIFSHILQEDQKQIYDQLCKSGKVD